MWHAPHRSGLMLVRCARHVNNAAAYLCHRDRSQASGKPALSEVEGDLLSPAPEERTILAPDVSPCKVEYDHAPEGRNVRSLTLRPKRFFVHHVRHLPNIAAVVSFQNVNQPLHAASGHALIWIGRKPRNPRRA